MAANPTREEIERRQLEIRQQAIATFPFERVVVPSEQALPTWEQLRSAGRGYPVVLGDDESIVIMVDALSGFGTPRRSVADIVAVAGALRHPEDLMAKRAADRKAAGEHIDKMLAGTSDVPLPRMTVTDGDGRTRELTREEIAQLFRGSDEAPPLGEWPANPHRNPELSVVRDYKGPFEKVSVALIPTDDWTTVPAHLRWGGWNACPEPEYHVAALRSWRDRYGAQLVGLSFDTMNLRMARRPQTRDEALELAREQYAYCNDNIDQVAGTLSNLAAALMVSDWWYFWWD